MDASIHASTQCFSSISSVGFSFRNCFRCAFAHRLCNGDGVQITYESRAIKSLMDRIDEQIKRMRSCEDFGMFDCCV